MSVLPPEQGGSGLKPYTATEMTGGTKFSRLNKAGAD